MIFPSLRARLIAIILAPLLVIAVGITLWQYSTETKRAKDLFDRGLLSAALAISRDVAISNGDALSRATRELVNNTSGGEVFYHVFAPDGVFVTGYSTPPVLVKSQAPETSELFYFDATYQGRDVRVLRFQYVTTVSEVAGVYNTTVWQNADLQGAFVRDLVTRSIAIIALLVVSVGLIVWFGVGIGLRPLLDLEDAIAKRTPTELEPIRRDVPMEARGIVSTLNALLDRVSRRISSKDEFIANAAHQLRNPVAGVLALAEAVENAPTPQAAKQRSVELLQAARQTSRLTNQLLSFERAAGSDANLHAEAFSLNDILTEVTAGLATELATRDVGVELIQPQTPLEVRGDRVMIKEAVLNIVNNALVHGGNEMNQITLDLRAEARMVVLTVQDNGAGIPADSRLQAINRFGQVNAGPGSGLGLPIAAKVMAQHRGHLRILDGTQGAAIEMRFPQSQT